ncbi:hypothetical protein AMECASPLE_006260 [Ameca splendens]|uniref:Uncharacterized protein n=1 Tax=Ameca splendens TaxID=208324 RepID=A0ABV0XCE7_9TELE
MENYKKEKMLRYFIFILKSTICPNIPEQVQRTSQHSPVKTGLLLVQTVYLKRCLKNVRGKLNSYSSFSFHSKSEWKYSVPNQNTKKNDNICSCCTESGVKEYWSCVD